MLDLIRLDHLLIIIPPGSKKAARKFYAEILLLKEVPGGHPRGAIWFEMADIQIHLREEEGHKTTSDRHPAFVVAKLEAAINFLKQRAIQISYSSEINGRERCFFRDPWGNRYELIEYKEK
ncbi:catechol 2,3-dioxygenase-like lactoylglutathione lyase family enzyme [Pedobacter cryoconitis]|uniref:VOC family protein n=1 Tax=Pedobacter cryoconitis TaxID=188932 RepID=UPI0016115E5B|nr:VOC family protein [Pedobacter cryoconitis]MBB6270814.1 catechol 2,3-dioxygenase-like lactoylglutathione lyase family enzyme [Pedobacter cryoconitis]